eukprot:8231959-Karenia_brevis.AAC.1
MLRIRLVYIAKAALFERAQREIANMSAWSSSKTSGRTGASRAAGRFSCTKQRKATNNRSSHATTLPGEVRGQRVA